jgi:hypothetical protein
VVSEIKRLGLGGNYVINLMVFDYGAVSPNNCVPASGGGVCDMAQSAIQAAPALNQQSGIPFSHIGLTTDIGHDDGGVDVTSLGDVATICSFAKSNGLAAVRFWSFDRDNGGPASSTGNGTGDAALAYTHQYMSACGVQ